MDNSANIEVTDNLNSFGDELSPGTELCGQQYVIDSYLNSGGFGITYLARDSLGRKIVIKECFPGAICCRTEQTVRLRSKANESEFSKILELFEREARALSELQHPYIVGVHQIFNDNDTAYMALDYIDGHDLLQVIEKEPERLYPDQIKQLLLKILDAVAYMHDRDILHRDISPDNILLEADNTPVLIDFGAARESATRVSRVLSKVLTVKDGYSPQEFYLAESEQAFSSDLYALAATFYHLVSGKAPPSSQVRLAAAAKQQEDPLDPLNAETIKGYDPYFLEAINRCLNIFPNKRLQNAREWRDLIDTERRKRLALEEAQNDREMEMRIAQLVQDSQQQTPLEPPAAQPAPPPDNAVSQPELDLAADTNLADTERDEVDAYMDEAAPDQTELDAELENYDDFPVVSTWNVVPLDDELNDEPDFEPDFEEANSKERSGKMFGQFFAGSYLIRAFRVALGMRVREVNR
ncbi:serine/threonine-protein kinase [Aliiroseovarius sp. KMU-50]|uniref:Serine/threonine-protein kinase n=1 Tax=Aliiroseovarius salicola TaxID=3009082 RepID=A0ABT4VX66_9RHOB|nr:serine/threonine-protein kinase [Aliiroseovarius sp. KMU-50]MDA5092855.1 serine/threonine-protein kinase [Aliiroseovarius sp. KMU-50]